MFLNQRTQTGHDLREGKKSDLFTLAGRQAPARFFLSLTPLRPLAGRKGSGNAMVIKAEENGLSIRDGRGKKVFWTYGNKASVGASPENPQEGRYRVTIQDMDNHRSFEIVVKGRSGKRSFLDMGGLLDWGRGIKASWRSRRLVKPLASLAWLHNLLIAYKIWQKL